MTRLSLQNILSLSLSISKNDIGNNLFSSGGEVQVVLKDVPEKGPGGRSLGTTSHGRAPISCCFLTDPNSVFFFVKYDPIRVGKLLEKPYALSLLTSRGGYSESNAFDMSVDKTPTTFLLSTACFHLSTNPIKEVSQF